MANKEKLFEMMQALLDDDGDAAEAALHECMNEKAREMLGITEEKDGDLTEKWNKEVKVSPKERGKYEGKTESELRSELAKIKKSGPHKKGSPEYEKMKELQFAIRAKSNWGKVK